MYGDIAMLQHVEAGGALLGGLWRPVSAIPIDNEDWTKCLKFGLAGLRIGGRNHGRPEA
jgi:hypothetical protein